MRPSSACKCELRLGISQFSHCERKVSMSQLEERFWRLTVIKVEQETWLSINSLIKSLSKNHIRFIYLPGVLHPNSLDSNAYLWPFLKIATISALFFCNGAETWQRFVINHQRRACRLVGLLCRSRSRIYSRRQRRASLQGSGIRAVLQKQLLPPQHCSNPSRLPRRHVMEI